MAVFKTSFINFPRTCLPGEMRQSPFPACSPHSADLAHNQNLFGQKTTEDVLTAAEKKFSPSPRKHWWDKTSAAEAVVVTSLTVSRVAGSWSVFGLCATATCILIKQSSNAVKFTWTWVIRDLKAFLSVGILVSLRDQIQNS